MSGKSHQEHAATGVRRVRMRTSGASMHCRNAGVLLIKPDESLRSYPKVLTDRLAHWAKVSPDKVCIAKRGPDQEWRCLTYAQVFAAVRSIGQALLDEAGVRMSRQWRSLPPPRRPRRAALRRRTAPARSANLREPRSPPKKSLERFDFRPCQIQVLFGLRGVLLLERCLCPRHIDLHPLL